MFSPNSWTFSIAARSTLVTFSWDKTGDTWTHISFHCRAFFFFLLVRADVCDDIMCLEVNFVKLNIYRVAEVCAFLKKDRFPSVLPLTMPIYGLVEHGTSESLHSHQISTQTSLFWTWWWLHRGWQTCSVCILLARPYGPNSAECSICTATAWTFTLNS